ncbi:hypothetical protein Dimus_002433 [Dionaea muscipula]
MIPAVTPTLVPFPTKLHQLHTILMKAKAHTAPGKRTFIVFSFFSILLLCFLASINEVRLDIGILGLSRSSCASFLQGNNTSSAVVGSNISSSADEDDDDIRVLIGILTLPDQYQRRSFLRLVYGTQTPVVSGARVDVKFVFCNLTKDDQKVLIALEIMRYDDIIIMDCKENMNKGKTYTYFSSLPGMLINGSDDDDDDHRRPRRKAPYPPYHYVMKADDDVYFRLENLVKSLRPLPREDLYYGYVIPCPSMDPFVHYMSGMGYLISWDLVEWIRGSEIPKTHIEGPEDKVFGEWIRIGHKGKNRYNAKWSMYNYPQPPTRCTHELWPDTIAVHLLKTQDKWIHTLNYFNVTNNLKPSKLYHI